MPRQGLLTGAQRRSGGAAGLASAALLAVAVFSHALLRPRPSSLLEGGGLEQLQESKPKFSFGNDVSSAGIEEAAGEAWAQAKNVTSQFDAIDNPSYLNPGDVRHGAVAGLKVRMHV